MNQVGQKESEVALKNVSSLKSYHEMLKHSVIEINELERLKINLKQLEDLHGRLQFAMTEIKSLMKRV